MAHIIEIWDIAYYYSTNIISASNTRRINGRFWPRFGQMTRKPDTKFLSLSFFLSTRPHAENIVMHFLSFRWDIYRCCCPFDDYIHIRKILEWARKHITRPVVTAFLFIPPTSLLPLHFRAATALAYGTTACFSVLYAHVSLFEITTIHYTGLKMQISNCYDSPPLIYLAHIDYLGCTERKE